jgi:uncharacterized membrane protein
MLDDLLAMRNLGYSDKAIADMFRANGAPGISDGTLRNYINEARLERDGRMREPRKASKKQPSKQPASHVPATASAHSPAAKAEQHARQPPAPVAVPRPAAMERPKPSETAPRTAPSANPKPSKNAAFDEA